MAKIDKYSLALHLASAGRMDAASSLLQEIVNKTNDLYNLGEKDNKIKV